LSNFESRSGSYVMRWPSTPSEGKIDVRVSGGVFMGVMVSVPLAGALDGAAREAADLCIVSYEDLVDRGLASLPGGGDESVLVKGVRACSVIR
jgi:hypothetical protein